MKLKLLAFILAFLVLSSFIFVAVQGMREPESVYRSLQFEGESNHWQVEVSLVHQKDGNKTDKEPRDVFRFYKKDGEQLDSFELTILHPEDIEQMLYQGSVTTPLVFEGGSIKSEASFGMNKPITAVIAWGDKVETIEINYTASNEYHEINEGVIVNAYLD